IVKNQIEIVGTETLGQTVRVGGVNIELKSGMGEITGLSIANPAGFADPLAFELERIRLAIHLPSLNRIPLVLNEFVLEAPVVSLEIREDDSTNLDEIIAHLEARAKDAPAKPAETDRESAAGDAEAEEMFFAVKDLKISGVELRLRHPRFGEEARDFVLPEIHLSGLGGGQGISPAGLSEVIVKAIAKEGSKQALKAEAEKQAEKLLDKAGEALFRKFDASEKAAAE
ncbi:MAG: hypothetical protein ACO3NW_09005, partial [Kiritimatiellia bacterium]